MPVRQIPLVRDEIYHICNRGINKQPTFITKRNYQRAYQLINYYQYTNLPVRFSYFLKFSKDKQIDILENLKKKNEKIIKFIAYCFMPNHYHFLVKQKTDSGIAHFISQFQNSYTKYFNTFYQKEGALFLDQFKAVRVESDEQLLHVSRYIHLNPYTAYVVKDFDTLFTYPWSSIQEYVTYESELDLCEKELIRSYFKNKDSYVAFLKNQAEYQRELGKIKHLLLDE